MSALQRIIYKHMQDKGIIITDGSEKDKKVATITAGAPLSFTVYIVLYIWAFTMTAFLWNVENKMCEN